LSNHKNNTTFKLVLRGHLWDKGKLVTS